MSILLSNKQCQSTVYHVMYVYLMRPKLTSVKSHLAKGCIRILSPLSLFSLQRDVAICTETSSGPNGQPHIPRWVKIAESLKIAWQCPLPDSSYPKDEEPRILMRLADKVLYSPSKWSTVSSSSWHKGQTTVTPHGSFPPQKCPFPWAEHTDIKTDHAMCNIGSNKPLLCNTCDVVQQKNYMIINNKKML